MYIGTNFPPCMAKSKGVIPLTCFCIQINTEQHQTILLCVTHDFFASKLKYLKKSRVHVHLNNCISSNEFSQRKFLDVMFFMYFLCA